MPISRNILYFNLILFISSSFVYSFPSPEGENDKPTEASDSAEGESGKELETISPEEVDKSKEEDEKEIALIPSPKEDETSEEEKEEEKTDDEKELPEKNEENLNDNYKKLVHLHALFNKAEIESSDSEIKEKAPIDMNKMKEEAFKLTNELNEREHVPTVSHKEFDKFWEEEKEKYGKKFPIVIEKVIHGLETEKEELVDKEGKNPETPVKVSTEASETALEVPKDTYAVRDANGKVCILAKFKYSISIVYPTEQSEQEFYINPYRPGNTSGNCGGPDEAPVLRRSTKEFTFTLIFDKISDDTWGVTSVELLYDISDLLDYDPSSPAKVVAKTKKGKWFETPFKKSYFCPAKEVFHLRGKNKDVVTVEMTDIHLQPYDVEDEKFSTSHRCDKVVIDGLDEEPFVRDETVPLAVGCTLALITLLLLVGFSVHRAYYAAKVDYNTVE